MTHTAILLAGRRPGIDPFAAANGTRLKALIPIDGRPMVARVAETLLSAPGIGAVRILTQDIEELSAVVPKDPRLTFIRSGEGIARSVSEVAGTAVAPWPVLVTTADHVLLAPATLAAFLARSGDADVAVSVVERAVVEARFPTTRRTWLRFRGGHWTGANLFALNGPAAHRALALWSEIEQDRKKGWKLVARFGVPLLLRALTRTITLQGALTRAGGKLGVAVKAVPLDDPLAAVDVDKQADLELATAVLQGRA